MKMVNQNARKAPRAAIIIEWGNALTAEASRPKRMLKQLEAQSRELFAGDLEGLPKGKKDFLLTLRPPLEVIILYDSADVSERRITALIQEAVMPDADSLAVRPMGAAGMDYYDVKNYGAEQTESELLVFLDSDVIPEEGWLANSLSEFVDPEIEVVYGNTYIDPYNVYAKAFALGWIFEPRLPDSGLRKIKRFHANNLAIRREIFMKHKFPKFEGSMHASCGQLADDLIAADVTIYQNPKARASHPPPNGMRHFILRGLAEGRDDLIASRIKTFEKASNPGHIPINKGTFQKGIQRLAAIAKNRETADLSIPSVPLATCIMTAYYSFYLCGNLIERLFPKFAREKIVI